MISVLVLGGGQDAEREVSQASAATVAKALQSAGMHVHAWTIDEHDDFDASALPGDVIFPVLHGPWGEGGPLQGLLEADGRPFVGSSSTAAALCMDKVQTKALLRTHGLKTPDWQVARTIDDATMAPPLVIKPVNEGSSVGLYLCDDFDHRNQAIEALLLKRDQALLERRIHGREVTVGLLGDDALPLIEILPAAGAYDFAAKYERSDTQYVVQPDLPVDVQLHCIQAAQRAGRVCDVRDLARVDLLVDADGTPWILEVNTMPGFTAQSLLPKAAAAAQQELPDLCAGLIRMAMARKQDSAQADTP